MNKSIKRIAMIAAVIFTLGSTTSVFAGKGSVDVDDGRMQCTWLCP